MRVRSLFAALSGVLLVSSPGIAGAEVVHHRDAVGDVASSPVGANAYVPDPAQAQGDIVATRVSFARHAVWIRYRLQDLATTGGGNFHLVGIRSDRRSLSVTIDAFPGHWEGRATVTDGRGVASACPVRRHLDYDRNRVGLRVPRPCLGRATWVRVGVRTTVAGTTYAYVDDANAAGYSVELRYGRRVHRR
jgi:hypothetical protein